LGLGFVLITVRISFNIAVTRGSGCICKTGEEEDEEDEEDEEEEEDSSMIGFVRFLR